ncbi:MAG: hypothetical protein ACR2IV_21725, partial [Bryobacteraceae bacterium]
MSSIFVSTKECSEREFAHERQRGGSSVAARIPTIILREASASSKIFSAQPWILVSATFALAAVATFAGMYLYATSLNASSMWAILSHLVSDTHLSMQVEGQGDRLLVTWDRQMPAVQSAKFGVLSIDDGPKHRGIALPPSELANGSILFKRASDDVTFRLEIHNSEGRPITGMLRVLDASTFAPSPVTQAKQLSNRPTNISRSVIKGREQHPSTRANPGTAPRFRANPLQLSEVDQRAGLPEFRFDVNQSSASLPLSPIPTRPPDFGSAKVPESSRERIDGEQHERWSEPGVVPKKPPSRSAQQSTTATVSNSKEMAQIGATQKFSSLQPIEFRLPKNPDATTSSIYVPPRPLKQVMPNTRVYGSSVIRGPMQIEVQIKINENGRVIDASVPRTRTNATGSPLAFQAIAAA